MGGWVGGTYLYSRAASCRHLISCLSLFKGESVGFVFVRSGLGFVCFSLWVGGWVGLG